MMAGRMRASKAKAPGLLRAETSSLRMFANFSLRLVRAIAGKVRSAEYRPRGWRPGKGREGAQRRKVPRSGYKIFTNHLRAGHRLDMISRLGSVPGAEAKGKVDGKRDRFTRPLRRRDRSSIRPTRDRSTFPVWPGCYRLALDTKIAAKRNLFVNKQHLAQLTELGLVEMRDNVPHLTIAGQNTVWRE